MAPLVLHYFPLRSRGEALRFLLHFTGTPFAEGTEVTSLGQWMRDENGVRTKRFVCGRDKGALPVLELADGSLVPDSLAIAEHIARENAASHPYLMGDSPDVTRRLWLAFDADPTPFSTDGSIAMVDPILNFFDEKVARERVAPYLETTAKGLVKWLGEQLGADYLGGSRGPSIADFQLFHAVNNVCTLDGGKTLAEAAPEAVREWYARIAGIPEVAAYLEARPKPGSKEVGNEGTIIFKYEDPSKVLP